jgi:diadenosine tetraphosphate (Ap4A) HIT family hydrolase
MKAVRSRSDKLGYKKYLESLTPEDGCQFCSIEQGHQQFVSDSSHFKIILNKFPYAKWDSQPVAEHLMIVPKQHTDTLRDLSFEESKEYVELISEYEHDGYNIYARTPGSNMKSVKHQHTHLIKLAPRHKTRAIFLSGPALFKPAR